MIIISCLCSSSARIVALPDKSQNTQSLQLPVGAFPIERVQNFLLKGSGLLPGSSVSLQPESEVLDLNCGLTNRLLAKPRFCGFLKSRLLQLTKNDPLKGNHWMYYYNC